MAFIVTKLLIVCLLTCGLCQSEDRLEDKETLKKTEGRKERGIA
jgi:hypothetical protein